MSSWTHIEKSRTLDLYFDLYILKIRVNLGRFFPTAQHMQKIKIPRTTDISMIPGIFLERLMGVEPTYAAWEAAVLPMNYSRASLLQIAREDSIADPFPFCKTKNGQGRICFSYFS